MNAVIVVEFVTVTVSAKAPPMLTVVLSLKSVPLMVTEVPPCLWPLVAVMDEIVGGANGAGGVSGPNARIGRTKM